MDRGITTPVQRVDFLFLLVIDSFMEMAELDMPAIIDAILSRTGFKNLHYVGHSRGTTVMFALLASQPEYNDKVT